MLASSMSPPLLCPCSPTKFFLPVCLGMPTQFSPPCLLPPRPLWHHYIIPVSMEDVSISPFIRSHLWISLPLTLLSPSLCVFAGTFDRKGGHFCCLIFFPSSHLDLLLLDPLILHRESPEASCCSSGPFSNLTLPNSHILLLERSSPVIVFQCHIVPLGAVQLPRQPLDSFPELQDLCIQSLASLESMSSRTSSNEILTRLSSSRHSHLPGDSSSILPHFTPHSPLLIICIFPLTWIQVIFTPAWPAACLHGNPRLPTFLR